MCAIAIRFYPAAKVGNKAKSAKFFCPNFLTLFDKEKMLLCISVLHAPLNAALLAAISVFLNAKNRK